jgi:hypothetical protein
VRYRFESCPDYKIKNMASENKKRKSDKKLHWGRGKNFMKWVGKGIKGLTYFTSSQRRVNNKIDLED